MCSPHHLEVRPIARHESKTPDCVDCNIALPNCKRCGHHIPSQAIHFAIRCTWSASIIMLCARTTAMCHLQNRHAATQRIQSVKQRTLWQLYPMVSSRSQRETPHRKACIRTTPMCRLQCHIAKHKGCGQGKPRTLWQLYPMGSPQSLRETPHRRACIHSTPMCRLQCHIATHEGCGQAKPRTLRQL